MSPVRKPQKALAEQPCFQHGSQRVTITCDIKVVTPIFAGGARAREALTDSLIRVPSIRGQLRFWWRATHAHTFETLEEMRQEEQRIWGGTSWKDPADSKGKVRKSLVRVCVAPKPGQVTHYFDTHLPFSDKRGYAIFPARTQPALGRLPLDCHFQFSAQISEDTAAPPLAPKRQDIGVGPRGPAELQILRSISAWILFGGYGGRTRRGLGSLSASSVSYSKDCSSQTPAELALLKAIQRPEKATLHEAFANVSSRMGVLSDVPCLAGSWLVMGQPTQDPLQAWSTAIGWLKDFRQDRPRPKMSSCGHRGHWPRPGQSQWPEPDKIRHVCPVLYGFSAWAHDPTRLGLRSSPVWPRASFGLPIVFKFQSEKQCGGQEYSLPEPGFIGKQPDGRWNRKQLKLIGVMGNQPVERLASPLIIKPIAIGDSFVPAALWLGHGLPKGMRVALRDESQPGRGFVSGSECDFDLLVGAGDPAAPPFAPLGVGLNQPRGNRVRRAFFSWLKTQRTDEVTL